MVYNEIIAGIQVVIIDFGGKDSDRPKHWSSEMDEWQGAAVTISDCDGEYVYISEDEGEWSWLPSDFEPYSHLDFNDPNLSYKRRKIDKHFEKIKTKWMTDQKKMTEISGI